MRHKTSGFGLQASGDGIDASDSVDSHDDDTLPPELAAFESQLKSLKPVTLQPVTLRWSRDKRAIRLATRRPTLITSLRYAPFRLLLVVAVSLLIALTLFWLMRRANDANPPQVVPGNGHQIAENSPPEPTIAELPPQPLDTRPVVYSGGTVGGGLSMRKQLALLLDEMQPQVALALESKRPDYPVMIIPVRHDAPPLSPEAKQAFQRRLQRIDFEI